MSQDIGYPMPGELPFRVRLAKFWDVLTATKAEIVARKEWVKKLYLAEWASYDGDAQVLTLTVDFTEETLPVYLTLVDRRLRLEAKTKLTYDFGIEVYDGKKIGDFEEFKNRLTALEVRAAKIMALTPLVERLKFDSYLSFYLHGEKRELTVNKDRYETDLDEATQKLAPLVPFASLCSRV